MKLNSSTAKSRGRRCAMVGACVAALLAAFMFPTALACSSSEREPEMPQSLRIRGVEPLNINVDEESIPVTIRILALSSRNRFDREVRSFERLWRDPSGVLGGEMLLPDYQEETIFPRGGQARREEIPFANPLPPDTAYVAILALFHTDAYAAERKRWELIPVDRIERSEVTLTRARIDVEAVSE